MYMHFILLLTKGEKQSCEKCLHKSYEQHLILFQKPNWYKMFFVLL